jgi:lactaldehyde dehydrogenase/glycolaldehyde dehydrogenase
MTYSIFGPDTLLGERPRILVAGEWIGTSETRPVDNPATGEVFTAVPESGSEHVERAMQAAAAAQKAWAKVSLPERGAVLDAVIVEIDRHAEELAQIVVAEQGKTITEARGEVEGIKNFFRVAASNRYRNVGELVAPNANGEHIMIREEPYGIVVAIIPWNFPAAIFGRKVAPALMAGNAIILKPSEITPLAPLAMARVCQLAGVPNGLINVITGPGPVIGDELVRHPLTKVVTVTGSTRAGREIMKAAAENIIGVSLELGGKAPVIVMEDADLDLAVQQAFEARFWNCGQVCTCNERSYVHRSRYDEFVSRITELAKGIQVGDPTDESSQMGPKVSQAEWDKVKEMVDRSIEQGARVTTGGDRPEGAEFESGYWFAPTILADCDNEMEIVQHEVFGPVLPIVPFDSYDEVVKFANSTDYGLTCYVFTESLSTAMQLTDDLDFGEVYVNKIGPEQPQAYHAGWKFSGLGGDDGQHGYQRYVHKKTVYLRYA